MAMIGNTNFYVKSVQHKFGSVEGKLAICCNDLKKTEITDERRRRILDAQKLIKEGREVDIQLKKYLTPMGRIRSSILEEDEKLDGYSCIFCTKRLPEKEMVRPYFDKDVIERAFRTLKRVSNLRPIRFWLNKRVKAHVFICYLSYLLLSVFKLNLESKGLNISSEEALEELETM